MKEPYEKTDRLCKDDPDWRTAGGLADLAGRIAAGESHQGGVARAQADCRALAAAGRE
jgi:hypothetical protein